MKPVIRAAALLIPASLLFFGADTYQKPPKEILDILNAPTTPTLSLSPSRAYAMQGSPVRYPPIAELAEPMLRLAGVRINPKTNGLHNATFNTNLTQADGYFDQGQITFTSGANNGLSRLIKSFKHTSGAITLATPLPTAPAAADTFTALPGCDLSMATCTSKFSNLLHFRGTPFVPTPETAF